jgi:hypothetical protein
MHLEWIVGNRLVRSPIEKCAEYLVNAESAAAAQPHHQRLQSLYPCRRRHPRTRKMLMTYALKSPRRILLDHKAKLFCR